MRINNRTDFELVMSLKDNVIQKAIPLPTSRFNIELYTREAVSFAKRITIYSYDLLYGDGEMLRDIPPASPSNRIRYWVDIDATACTPTQHPQTILTYRFPNLKTARTLQTSMATPCIRYTEVGRSLS